jgi:hypothetical protein
MFQLVAMTQTGCRWLIPCHLRNNINTLSILVATVLIAQVTCPRLVIAEPSDRPNVLLIMTDDKCLDVTAIS